MLLPLMPALPQATTAPCESDNERLTARVAEMQKAAIEDRVAGPGMLSDGADLWLAGITVDDLLDDQGSVDPEKVQAALDQTLAEHPSWKDRSQPGMGGGARGTQAPAPSFGEALKNPTLRRP